MSVLPFWGHVDPNIESWDVEDAMRYGRLSSGGPLYCRLMAWEWLRLRQVWEQDWLLDEDRLEIYLWGIRYLKALSVRACFRSLDKSKIRLRRTMKSLRAVSRPSRIKDILFVTVLSLLACEEHEINFCCEGLREAETFGG